MLEVGGLSLVARAVRVAVESDLFDDVCVTSDWDEALSEGAKFGATAILRPTALAGDDSPIADAIQHALGTYRNGGIEFDSVCLLNPTSPLRSVDDVRACYKAHESGGSESTLSVRRDDSIRMIGALNSWMPENAQQNRQGRQPNYVQTGSIYFVNVKYLRNTKRLVSDKSQIVVIPDERSIDIDTENDLAYARLLAGREAIGGSKPGAVLSGGLP